MTDILVLNDYLAQCVEAIPELKTPFLVIDDSQITKIIKDLKSSDNLILMGLIPSHGTEGGEDTVRSTNFFSLMVLKKVDREIKHVDFIANLRSCQMAAKELYKKIIMDKLDGECGSFLQQLDIKSMKIDPIWQLAGADGYEISFMALDDIT